MRQVAARRAVVIEHRIERGEGPVFDDTLQLPHVRDPPIAVAGEVGGVQLVQEVPDGHLAPVAGPDIHVAPVVKASISALLLPHEARVEVRYGAVAIVGVRQRCARSHGPVIRHRDGAGAAVLPSHVRRRLSRG